MKPTRKNSFVLKKMLFIGIFIMALFCTQLFALTQNELAMFKTLESKWKQQGDALLQERSTVGASDPRYTELTKQIIKADYKESYYKEAQIDKSSMWVILTNTIIWSASDIAETANIMWDTSENLLQNIYTANWTALLKDTADALMRQKVRTMIRETFSQENRTIEDHILANFIMPKLEKSKTDGYAQQAYETVKEGLKDAYVDEVKRQAVGKSSEELKKYGEKITKSVGGAVEAAEFSIDMVQKFVMWDEAQPIIKNMLSAIQKIQSREACSIVKAFNIYLGKEHLSEPEPQQTTIQKNADQSSDQNNTSTDTKEPYTLEKPSLVWKEATDERFASRTAEQILAEYVKEGWTSKETYEGTMYYDEKHTVRLQVRYWSEEPKEVIEIIGYNPTKSFSFYYMIGNKAYRSPEGMLLKEIHGENYGFYLLRSWYLNGQIQEYKEYKYFSCIEHTKWDENGNITYQEKK